MGRARSEWFLERQILRGESFFFGFGFLRFMGSCFLGNQAHS